jgi:hypothetical protein
MHMKSSPYHKPPSMPNCLFKEEKYRVAHGTSIAVRLDPSRDQSGFDLQRILQKYILHPPVEIRLHGEDLPVERRHRIETPWLVEPFEIPFTDEETATVARVFGVALSQPIALRFVPLNLSEYSGTPKMLGQALLAYVSGVPDEWRTGRGDPSRKIYVAAPFADKDGLRWRINLTYEDSSKLRDLGLGERRELEDRIRTARDRLRTLLRDLGRPVEYYDVSMDFDSAWLDQLDEYLQRAGDLGTVLETAVRLYRRATRQENPPSGPIQETVTEDAERLARYVADITGDSALASAVYYSVRYVDSEAARHVEEAAMQLQEGGTQDQRRRQSKDEARRELATYRRLLKNRAEVYREETIGLLREDLPAALAVLVPEESSETYRWLSHNGVHVPTFSAERYSTVFAVRAPVQGGVFALQLALRDDLRPDLSLSRDDLRSLNWKTYSHLSLALSRAFRIHLASIRYELQAIFQDSLKKRLTAWEEILREVDLREAWETEPIIELDGTRLSVHDIRKQLQLREKSDVSISNPVNIGQWFHGAPNFISCCIAVLLHAGLTVTKGSGETLTVKGPEPAAIQDGQLLFPPLFFIPYDSNPSLLRYGGCPINSRHPLAAWLIEHARRLRSKHPGLF